MSNNDLFLIDGIVDELVERNPQTKDRGKVFEVFAAEQVVKDYCLNQEDIIYSIVDGRNDGGFDFAFIFVNGHFLKDVSKLFWPKSNIELDVYIITSKHHDTFKQAPLDNIVATIDELYNFRIPNDQMSMKYAKKLLLFRDKLIFAYKKSSSKLNKLNFKYVYTSRGDSEAVGESIIERSNQIIDKTKRKFTDSLVSFEFCGSSELIALNRKNRNFSHDLPYIEVLSMGERYVLLAHIEDYYNFIVDENKKLRRYLFDSNVRDFMGLNSVNEDIKMTLQNHISPDFWWLNNGITIIATSAKVIGDSITIEDVQIVNGLQTSESIYNYFHSGGSDPEKRSILVKVIITNDADVRDMITKATNNQTNVQLSALHASDKVQKDIDDALIKYGYYYERRTNYYQNQGIDKNRIIQPLYIAAGFVNLVLKHPYQASRLKNRFMRNVNEYNKVFNHKYDLIIWYKITEILKFTDRNIDNTRSKKNNTEGLLRKWRHTISFIFIAKYFETFDYKIHQLVNVKIDDFNDQDLIDLWGYISNNIPKINSSQKLSNNQINEAIKISAKKYEIENVESIFNRITNSSRKRKIVTLSDDFVNSVDNVLPEQPWKPGIHAEISKQLGCSKSDYFKATSILIQQGKRYFQKDGIVYDSGGNIIMIDEERVDPVTKELKT